MGLIPLPEGGRVDLDDGALHEGVGPDELVVGGVIDLSRWIPLILLLTATHSRPSSCKPRLSKGTHHTDEPRLLCDLLAAPCKVARLEAKSAVLEAAAAHAHGMNALGTELCARRLAAELELSLLAVVGALRA